MYVDYSRPPFIDIPLPPATILPAHKLIALYAGVLLVDFSLLRHEQNLHSFISSKQLRIIMTIYHIIIPMLYISNNPPLNILYAACPWFLASYSAHMPKDQLTFVNWYYSILAITIDDKDQQYTPVKIRMKGVAKIALGIFKLAFCHLIVDPLLPRYPEYALEYPWLNPYSMVYTVLFGVKGHCYLGAVDVFMGLEQLLFGWNMVGLFNYPILSSSPRDFWSRRWNRVVHNLLHDQVFNNYEGKPHNESVTTSSSEKVVKEKDIKPATQRKSFWATRRGTGLLAFIVSGTFHELIIMSACRRITLEHFMFFTLQGVLCMIEVEIRQGALKQEPTGKTRIACIAFHLLLMSVFGRLFTGPLLRYNFF